MSVKQRKRRAAKRAHHAKQSYPLRACLFTGRIDDYIDGSNPTARRSLVYSEIGINAHRDAGKISSTEKLWGGWHPSHENIGFTPYDLIRREMFKNDVRHALNDLGIPGVVVALRDDVIRKVEAELARSDHDDFLYVDTLNGWRTWLSTQGEYILVSETLKLPIGKTVTDEILDALKAKFPERHATSAETLLGELNKYGAKVERAKSLDHLGMIVDLSLHGKINDIDKDLFERVRELSKQVPFLPSLSQLQPDLPSTGDLVLDVYGASGSGSFKIIKGRDPVPGEHFVIDSVPEALRNVEVDKPSETPYGTVFFSTPVKQPGGLTAQEYDKAFDECDPKSRGGSPFGCGLNNTMMMHKRMAAAEGITVEELYAKRGWTWNPTGHSVLTSDCRTELSRQTAKEGEVLPPELEIKGVHLKQSKLDPSEVRRLVEAYGDIAEKQLIEKFFSEMVTSERDDEAFQKAGRACLFRMLEAQAKGD